MHKMESFDTAKLFALVLFLITYLKVQSPVKISFLAKLYKYKSTLRYLKANIVSKYGNT